jgi:hypothetical protein
LHSKPTDTTNHVCCGLWDATIEIWGVITAPNALSAALDFLRRHPFVLIIDLHAALLNKFTDHHGYL